MSVPSRVTPIASHDTMLLVCLDLPAIACDGTLGRWWYGDLLTYIRLISHPPRFARRKILKQPSV